MEKADLQFPEDQPFCKSYYAALLLLFITSPALAKPMKIRARR
jgi:hypothetical protein